MPRTPRAVTRVVGRPANGNVAGLLASVRADGGAT
jgi:hypothetical protein